MLGTGEENETADLRAFGMSSEKTGQGGLDEVEYHHANS